jgi:hypothetical protein
MTVTGRRVIPIKKTGQPTEFRTIGTGTGWVQPIIMPTPPSRPTGPGYTEPPTGVSWTEWGQSKTDQFGWWGWEGYYTLLYLQNMAELERMAALMGPHDTYDEGYQYDALNMYEQAMVDYGAGDKLNDPTPMLVMFAMMGLAGIPKPVLEAAINNVAKAWAESAPPAYNPNAMFIDAATEIPKTGLAAGGRPLAVQIFQAIKNSFGSGHWLAP